MGPGVLYHQVQGTLGANLVSSIAAGAGIIILIANLKNSLAYISFCQEASVDDFCLAVFFCHCTYFSWEDKDSGPQSKKEALISFSMNMILSRDLYPIMWYSVGSCTEMLAAFPPTPVPRWLLQVGVICLEQPSPGFPTHVCQFIGSDRVVGDNENRGCSKGTHLGDTYLVILFFFWLSLVVVQQKIVAMILFLTILGFGVAVALTVYRVGELFKRDKVGQGLIPNPE